ncbi:FAD-binding oxidoreductase [Paraburkholderia fungorum]|uniref:FAD dependent oxidoreductase domain-containing protein n=1 Tax=Paraburkholderia fungorum TaxID=134537 RepID=A0A3R7GND5_9BURK|nr:FAD-dependent oxidoreductase [Paraburkholderia fungorum]RKF34435.1 hypothetical protein BCY88_38205 [Paraburkholderia fungorum]
MPQLTSTDELSGRRQRVLVVGAGIIGLAVALRLQHDGHGVSIVDRDEPMSGCSAGNAGHLTEANIFPPLSLELLLQLPRLLLMRDGPVVVRPSYALQMAAWVRHALPTLNSHTKERIVSTLAAMSLSAYEELRQLAHLSGAQDLLHRDGAICAFRSLETLDRKAAALAVWQANDIKVDRLDADELAEMEPALCRPLAGGFFFRNSGRCSDPKEFGMRMFRRLTNAGATFHKTRVDDVQRTGDGLRLATSSGHLQADKVVLCAGYGTGELIRRLGGTAPLASERGYHLMLPQPSITLRRPVAFPEHYFIATPMDNGLRLGGTAEFSQPDAPPDYRRAHAMLSLVQQYLPGTRGTDAQPWMGVRPSLPDGLPAIGELGRQPGVFYAFGHGHTGLTLSGITASCVSALLGGDAPSFDFSPLDLKRFA